MTSLFDLFISDPDTFAQLKTLAAQDKLLSADDDETASESAPEKEIVIPLLPLQTELISTPVGDLDICLVQGGINCGKTWGATLHALMLARDNPGSVGLVAAYHWYTLRDTVWPQLQKHMDTLGMKRNIHYRMNLRDRRITLANGSVIYFRPIGRSEAFTTLKATWIYVDQLEAVPPPLFARLMTCLGHRLTLPDGTVAANRFFATSPAMPPAHWITRFFVLNAGLASSHQTDNADDSKRVQNCKNAIRRITADSEQNPFQPPHYLPMLQALHTPEAYAALTQGIHPLETPDTLAALQTDQALVRPTDVSPVGISPTPGTPTRATSTRVTASNEGATTGEREDTTQPASSPPQAPPRQASVWTAHGGSPTASSSTQTKKKLKTPHWLADGFPANTQPHSR